VADVGCGHGASTIILAEAFPESEFVGFDYHDASIERARSAAVEPLAGGRVEDNLNPVGRLFYSASTALCVPGSLDQEVGLALGAQAGEERIAAVVREGGFGTVRRVAETPFNMVLEARP